MGNNNLEEKNVSMPEKIGGVIFGIWFVASIIAGFVASEIGTDAVMLVVGQFFAGIVLVIILKTLIPMIKKRKRGRHHRYSVHICVCRCCIGADMGGVCCERWLFCG